MLKGKHSHGILGKNSEKMLELNTLKRKVKHLLYADIRLWLVEGMACNLYADIGEKLLVLTMAQNFYSMYII